MIKKLLVAAFCMGVCQKAAAQEVLLKQDVKADEKTETWGPNLKYYMHTYVGYGLIAGAPEATSSRINFGSSHDWQFGMRFKLKVAEYYALGLEAAVNPQTFYVKQKEGKTLPNTMLHDSEKLRLTNIGLGFFNRINYNKRGNHMGNFVDLGVYGNWLAASTHIYRDKLESSGAPSAKEITVKLHNLNYLTDFNYGVTARLGFNRYVFYGTYRLSDYFNNKQGKFLAELPRVVAGLQVSFHK